MTPSRKIALITSGHPADDERIYHKIGKSLARAGYTVSIIATIPPQASINDSGISCTIIPGNAYLLKFRGFISALRECAPDIVICCEVFPVFSAFAYRKQIDKKVIILQDITEWYPENVTRSKTAVDRAIRFAGNYFLLILSCLLTNAFIYGEKRKFLRFHAFAPRKSALEIGYYPPLRALKTGSGKSSGRKFTLCYTGILSGERGFFRFLNLLDAVSSSSAAGAYQALVIGKFPDAAVKEEFEAWQNSNAGRIPVEFREWKDYENFLSALSEADICLDLRDQNNFYAESLPIKIFDYLLAGKPVVYSDLRALREDVPVEEFGFLVDPDDTAVIFSILEMYRTDAALYARHAATSRMLAETKYNWQSEETKLIGFISALLQQK